MTGLTDICFAVLGSDDSGVCAYLYVYVCV